MHMLSILRQFQDVALSRALSIEGEEGGSAAVIHACSSMMDSFLSIFILHCEESPQAEAAT